MGKIKTKVKVIAFLEYIDALKKKKEKEKRRQTDVIFFFLL